MNFLAPARRKPKTILNWKHSPAPANDLPSLAFYNGTNQKAEPVTQNLNEARRRNMIAKTSYLYQPLDQLRLREPKNIHELRKWPGHDEIRQRAEELVGIVRSLDQTLAEQDNVAGVDLNSSPEVVAVKPEPGSELERKLGVHTALALYELVRAEPPKHTNPLQHFASYAHEPAKAHLLKSLVCDKPLAEPNLEYLVCEVEPNKLQINAHYPGGSKETVKIEGGFLLYEPR